MYPEDKIKEALLQVDVEVFHYYALHPSDRYVVWAEDGEGAELAADNRKIGQVLSGTIDFFTKTEQDPAREEIQRALEDAEISYSFNSVQYEEETRYIHYEWRWEVVG